MATPEKIDFPHIKYMQENGITRERITQDYLANMVDNWASAKIKYDDAVQNATYKDEAEREADLTAMQNRLADISEEIYDDLEVEFPRNDGFIDVNTLAWPHIESMKKHFVKTVNLDQNIQKKIQAFNAKFNYLKENPFASAEEQEAYIKVMRKDSLDIEKDVKSYLSTKTTQEMDQHQTAKIQEKEQKVKQDRIDALTAEIKKLVTDKHDFTGVIIKIDELRTLQPDVKELEEWVKKEKTKYFEDLRKNSTCEDYLTQLVADKKNKISGKELGGFKDITVPKKSLLPSTSGGTPTSFIVGKFLLTAADFLDEWKIEDAPKAQKKEKEAAAAEQKKEPEAAAAK